MKYEQLIQAAISCGAAKAAIIPQENIVLSEEFRKICEGNGCGKFGTCYMCPPDVGPIDQLMARIRGYERGLLYQTITEIEDSFDIEGMGEAGKAHARMSQKLRDALEGLLGEGRLHLASGGCGLCDVCAKRTNEPCRHPDRALPSMESYGVDVYKTCKGTDLKYINGQNTVTYFGLVLFSEREDG